MWHRSTRATPRAVEGRLPMITQASHSLRWTLFLLRYAPEDDPCKTLPHVYRPLLAEFGQPDAAS